MQIRSIKARVAITLATTLLCFLAAELSLAHSGRTNSDGCHNNRKTGGYHCHGIKRHSKVHKPYKATSSYSSSSLSRSYKDPRKSYPELDKNLVRETQRLLNLLGYKAGPEDGVMGKKTASAIRIFELDHIIPITGLPSEELLVVLRKEAAEDVAKSN